MKFSLAGVDSLIIYFSDFIDEKTAVKVKKAYLSIKNLNLDGLVEIIPSYTSIFIQFDIFKYDYKSLKNILLNSINLDIKEDFEEKIITIDVYYGLEVGFDLQKISLEKSLTIDEIIQIHSSKIYDVYTIGFLPAFAYLGCVDERIASTRLKTPRTFVPKGSVAMADFQTAVYPLNSPAGWNIIGKTALELFDKRLDSLSVFQIGNRVKFNSISKEEFLSQGGIL
ncbi:MAG: 5-oxoprolinase subunit PxpB [Aliarcobacter sp.]|nr:5-oxoprolinase subunit PxpB [Aliarcobacter sp.]